jgi:hypothetical protein
MSVLTSVVGGTFRKAETSAIVCAPGVSTRVMAWVALLAAAGSTLRVAACSTLAA